MVKAPSELWQSSDVEVIESTFAKTSGPGEPAEKSQGPDDDLISLFAGNDFNPSDDNTSLLTNINSASSTKRGHPVSPHLAKIIDQRLSCEIDREKLNLIVSNYKTPQNCEQMYLTKINQEIWSQLPAMLKEQISGWQTYRTPSWEAFRPHLFQLKSILQKSIIRKYTYNISIFLCPYNKIAIINVAYKYLGLHLIEICMSGIQSYFIIKRY